MPPHARAGWNGRGHRFAAYPRCSTSCQRERDVADGVILTTSRATGPVGTGVYALRWTTNLEGVRSADVWLTLLFFPCLPLGRWEVVKDAQREEAWLVQQVRSPHLTSSLWILGATIGVGLSLVPGYLALSCFMGHKLLELGGTFTTAGLILGALGWLDQTRERVPTAAALRVMARGVAAPNEPVG